MRLDSTSVTFIYPGQSWEIKSFFKRELKCNAMGESTWGTDYAQGTVMDKSSQPEALGEKVAT